MVKILHDAIGNYADQAAKTMEGERREILTALEAIYKLEKMSEFLFQTFFILSTTCSNVGILLAAPSLVTVIVTSAFIVS